MSKWTAVGAAFVGCAAIMAGISFAAPPDDATKKVMKEAMKSGLFKKVATGKASADEKKDLLSFMEALAKSTPPKGDAGDWKDRTTALVEAAREAVSDRPTASAKLKAAGNCKSCHDVHREE